MTIFRSEALGLEWAEIGGELARVCMIEDGKTGAVNPGDRRAIYYLIRGLGAKSALEIGTHVGASTIHIAVGLRSIRQRDSAIETQLTTVDIQDVNHPDSGYWRKMGLRMSPQEMIAAVGCGEMVRFVSESSLSFLQRCEEKFDFIFLDGDHSGHTVYQEIVCALRLLKKDGVVLLHDYFPKNRPLWSDGKVMPGPFIATERLRAEEGSLEVVPLGELPWPTKLNSRVTSLAVLVTDRKQVR